MTTVINNPGENREPKSNGTSAGSGVVIGAVIVILILVVVIVLALPYMREQVEGMRSPGNPTINVQLPSLPSPSASTTTP